MQRMVQYDWRWFDEACRVLANKVDASKVKFENIYGIPRGGLFVATRLSYLLDLPMIQVRRQIGPRTLIADDLSDSGGTFKDLFAFLNPLELPMTAVLHTGEDTSFVPTFSYEIKSRAAWACYPWEAGATIDTVSQVRP